MTFDDLARTARSLKLDDWPAQRSTSARAEELVAAALGRQSHFIEKIRDVSFAPFYAPASDAILQRTWRDGCETLAGLIEAARDAATAAGPAVPAAEERLALLLRRFHGIASQLKERPQKRPPLVMGDEYDVQYLLRALLLAEFGDVRDEEYTPSYAGANARVDFLLATHAIAVEVKRTRDGLRDREIGQELLVDIKRYAAHPNVRSLVCFIYDPDALLKNVHGLAGDLEMSSTPELRIRVIIAPAR
jgi:hypothetical protein